MGAERQPAPVRADLFSGDGLVGGRCHACDRHHFPAGALCPYCGADQVERVTLSRTGTLWAWTAVTAAPPGYRGSVPYGFGVVELREGIRVVTRLTEPDPARLSHGEPVRFEITTLPADDGTTVTTYAFAPAP